MGVAVNYWNLPRLHKHARDCKKKRSESRAANLPNYGNSSGANQKHARRTRVTQTDEAQRRSRLFLRRNESCGNPDRPEGRFAMKTFIMPYCRPVATVGFVVERQDSSLSIARDRWPMPASTACDERSTWP